METDKWLGWVVAATTPLIEIDNYRAANLLSSSMAQMQNGMRHGLVIVRLKRAMRRASAHGSK
jgi:hypothetical protein